ncbi:tetratricopeptide repeat protein, partial [bacterium]|nr:tetratricopeptide repeat protein [bacterium]
DVYRAISLYSKGKSGNTLEILDDLEKKWYQEKNKKKEKKKKKIQLSKGTLSFLQRTTGQIYFKENEFEKSYKKLKKALTNKKEDYRIHYYLGKCSYELGKMDEAKQYLKDVCRQLPNSRWAVQAEILLEKM